MRTTEQRYMVRITFPDGTSQVFVNLPWGRADRLMVKSIEAGSTVDWVEQTGWKEQDG
jgi:hypothetical protein